MEKAIHDQLEEEQDRLQNNVINIALGTAGVLLSPITGGASLALSSSIMIGVSSVDIVRQEVEQNQTLTEYNNDESFRNAWNIIYNTVQIVDAIVAIPSVIELADVLYTSFREYKQLKATKTLIKEEFFNVVKNAAHNVDLNINTRLDNLVSTSHCNAFINDLVNFANSATSSSTTTLANRLSRYGDAQKFKSTLKSLIENSQVNNVKPYSSLIDDIEYFILNHRNVNGATGYFDELLQSPLKFKGGAFGLEILHNKPSSIANLNLTALELKMDVDGNFRFDLFFEGSGNMKIFAETKNYALKTSFTSSFYSQFKSYISNSNVKSINNLKYFFRANTGVLKENRVQKFKDMLLVGERYEEIFNANNIMDPIDWTGFYQS